LKEYLNRIKDEKNRAIMLKFDGNNYKYSCDISVEEFTKLLNHKKLINDTHGERSVNFYKKRGRIPYAQVQIITKSYSYAGKSSGRIKEAIL
jgi:hypothetical protein